MDADTTMQFGTGVSYWRTACLRDRLFEGAPAWRSFRLEESLFRGVSIQRSPYSEESLFRGVPIQRRLHAGREPAPLSREVSKCLNGLFRRPQLPPHAGGQIEPTSLHYPMVQFYFHSPVLWSTLLFLDANHVSRRQSQRSKRESQRRSSKILSLLVLCAWYCVQFA